MRERLTNNLGLKIFAFLAAVVVWIIVVNVDDPLTTRTYNQIPVSVINAEILSSEQMTYQIVDGTQEVTVTVEARRQVLDEITPLDIVAVADMKDLTLQTQIPIEVSINGFAGQYESAAASPVNLQVKLEEEETRRFPIVPTTYGTVRDGFVLGEIQAVPEKVSIRGPKSVIESISRVEAPAQVSGLSSDTIIESELVLYDEDNNVIDQTLLSNNLGEEGVSVNVEILNTKSVPVEFDTSSIHTAAGYSFTGIEFEPGNIQVAGLDEDLAALDEILVPAEALQFDDLDERTEQIVNVSDYLPDTISLADENAGSVVVTIGVEKDGTRTYEVTVASLSVNHLLSRFNLSYVTVDALQIQVRGPEESLDAFEPEKNVSINLSECREAGTYTVPVSVNVPEDCELENEVSVELTLTEIESSTQEEE